MFLLVISTAVFVALVCFGIDSLYYVVVYGFGRVRMAESSFFPVEEFMKLLRQLSTGEFGSERIKRYSSIREQIEALIRSGKIVESLALTLHKEMSTLLTCLPTPSSGNHSFQIALWPKFHSFRLKEVPRIWKVAEGIVPGLDPILVQKATLLYLTVIMNNAYPTCKTPKEGKQHRREGMSMEEHNAVRYVAGYVVRKMKKKYSNKGSVSICQCLLQMEEGNSLPEESVDYNFMSYTRAWVQIIDRGGLFKVSDRVYCFFLELELSLYPHLRKQLEINQSNSSKEELLHTVESDEDVQFAWSFLTVDLTEPESSILLKDVIQLWTTIRGYSIAAQFMEDYKQATRRSTKAKTSLRKELLDAGKGLHK